MDEHVVTAVSERLQEVEDFFNSLRQPHLKERRQFPVRVIRSLYYLIGWLAVKSSYFNSYEAVYGCALDGVPATRLQSPLRLTSVLAIILQGPRITLDTHSREPLRINLSPRARAKNLGAGKLSIREQWVLTLDALSSQRGTRSIRLPLLFKALGQNDLAHVASTSWKGQSFFCELVQLVLYSEDEPLAPSTHFDSFCEEYGYATPLLELHTRKYPARADERAFVVDSDAFRSLAAAILQAVLLPKTTRDRQQLFTESVNPAVDKNTLKVRIELPPTRLVMATVSDTSSFTSSNVNLWVVPLAILLAITENEAEQRLSELFTVLIGSNLVEVTLSEVLQVYLFTTVGARCRDVTAGEMYVSQGGYLGVGANMTLCLLAQSLQLISIQSDVGYQFDVSAMFQSGGDDVFHTLTGKHEHVIVALGHVKDHMTKYIGFQKEFGSFPLVMRNFMARSPLALRFCKKALIATPAEPNGCEALTIDSVYNLPFMEQLFTPKLTNQQSRRKELNDFASAVKEAVSRCTEPIEAFNIFMHLYLELKCDDLPNCIPTTTDRNVSWKSSDVEERQELLATNKAWVLLDGIHAVQGSREYPYLTTLLGKFSYALSCGLMRKVQGVIEGRTVNVYTTAREKTGTRSAITTNVFVGCPKTERFGELLKRVQDVRALIASEY